MNKNAIKPASQTLTTWGRVRFAKSTVLPVSHSATWIKKNPGKSVMAYGSGRCYGDQSLNNGGVAVLTGATNLLHSLDEASGEAIVDAGITFNALSKILHPRGFTYPVSAATGAVSIGGAIANDIHSKNHCHLGSFGQHVNWIDLMLADGLVIRTSRKESSDIFRATVGGMGLTGVIVRASVTMLKIPSTSVTARYQRKPDLDSVLDELEDMDSLPPYWFAWVDAMATGAEIGRGVLETGSIAESNDGCQSMPRVKSIPFSLPNFFSHPTITTRINRNKFMGIPSQGVEVIKPLEAFYFPLDHISGFNKFYGRRGFYSIHCGIPFAEHRGIRKLLTEVVNTRAGGVGTVIKPMGGTGGGFMSFPIKGVVLAIDMPNRQGVVEVHKRLERITLDHGGRLYASKDSLMSATGFEEMYPQLPQFRAVLAQIDPQGVFQSDMSRRLKIRNEFKSGGQKPAFKT